MEDFNSDKANLSPGELYQDESVYFWLKEAIEWINKKIEGMRNLQQEKQYVNFHLSWSS